MAAQGRQRRGDFVSKAPPRSQTKLSPASVVITALVLACASLLASCGTGTITPSKLSASRAATPTPSTVPGTPTSPVTQPPGVTPSTEVNTYPTPYSPGYTSIAQLVEDSTFIVLGTLQSGASLKDGNGDVVTAYPIDVQQSLGTVPPVGLNVSQAEVMAAGLSVGNSYIFFWGADTADDAACIVGGVRGVMSYDPTSDTVTRLDKSTSSQVPQSQTLEQLESSVRSAQITFGQQPIRNQPPICSPSATGLPATS